MVPLRCSPRSVLLAAALLVYGVHANAELAASSPFLPPQGQSIAAPTTGAPLEFRGVTTDGGNTKFSIFDPSKKSGTWIGLNESGYDFAVKKYDADSDTVTVDYQGRSMTLAMKTPKIASLGNAVAPLPMSMPTAGPVPVPAAGAPNLVTRNVVANPTPATEAARLADWQAEIQRRRDMRAQQATQPATGAQPAVQPQVQPMQPQTTTQPRQRTGQGQAQRQRN